MRASTLLVVTVALLLGCRGEDDTYEGTSVGNPTTTMFRLAPSEGLEHTEASVFVHDVVLVACGGPARQIVLEQPLSLIDGAVELPGGRWCALEMALPEPVHVAGFGLGGGNFDLTLGVGFIYVEAGTGWEIDGGVHIWEIGMPGWITDAELGVGPGNDVVVVPEDEIHAVIVERLHGGSGIYEDNGDGILEPDERELGEVAHAPEPPPGDTGDGTEPGCQGCRGAGGPQGAPLVLLGLLAAVHRRRRRPKEMVLSSP